MRRLKILLFAAAALGTNVAVADSWILRARDEVYRFKGDLTFTYTIDPVDGGKWAKFAVKVHRKRLLAQYSGLGFEELIASPDGTLFVGLSNTGIPGTAVAVFSSEGRLLLHVEHDVARFDYCDETITLVRNWYTPGKDSVQFGDGLADLSLLDCHGKRVNLLESVSQAYARGLAEHREWKAKRAADTK
jgi:hypothetical protein